VCGNGECAPPHVKRRSPIRPSPTVVGQSASSVLQTSLGGWSPWGFANPWRSAVPRLFNSIQSKDICPGRYKKNTFFIFTNSFVFCNTSQLGIFQIWNFFKNAFLQNFIMWFLKVLTFNKPGMGEVLGPTYSKYGKYGKIVNMVNI